MLPRLVGCWADDEITSCWPGGFFPVVINLVSVECTPQLWEGKSI